MDSEHAAQVDKGLGEFLLWKASLRSQIPEPCRGIGYDVVVAYEPKAEIVRTTVRSTQAPAALGQHPSGGGYVRTVCEGIAATLACRSWRMSQYVSVVKTNDRGVIELVYACTDWMNPPLMGLYVYPPGSTRAQEVELWNRSITSVVTAPPGARPDGTPNASTLLVRIAGE